MPPDAAITASMVQIAVFVGGLMFAGGTCLWAVVRYLERRREEMAADLHARLSGLRDDLTQFKIEAATRFATAASMDRGFEKLEKAITDLGARLERWIDNERRGRGSGPGGQ
ncbi:hypothetical protein [Thalassobaculum sp.]|uniref:hypothetical protein n=1 Tax=Thalassobaculum sp. TaxID=2022740 RepID=UPI0032ED1333